ncbi:MAG: FHA domain-containing protein [Planctomycetota bacterium]|nr:MAG: FHA domain-containing protein [Planctomycetota bacterium]
MAGRRLVVVSEREHRFVDLDDLDVLRIGRAPENDVVIKDDMVSRRHCQVEVGADGRLRIRDLKSFNGTYLNERRVRDEPFQLWDCLRVGRTKMFLVDRVSAPEERAAGQPPGEPVASPASEERSADPPSGEPPNAEPAAVSGPEEMGKTRTMELDAAAEGAAALLTNKELRAAVEGIVRREREEAERQISRRIRDESGPSVLASLEGYKVRVRRAGPVDGGGDFFDVFRPPLAPRALSFCVGSVSGVGVAACIAAATARHTLRGACACAVEDDPRAVVEAVAEVLARTLHPGSALSLLLAHLGEGGRVRVGCMGGTGVLHYKAASEEVEVLRPPGRRDEEAARAVSLEAQLRPDDRLLLASDGAGSLRGSEGRPYGGQRLADRLQTLGPEDLAASDLLARLVGDAVDFAAGAPERDVTLLAIHRVGA